MEQKERVEAALEALDEDSTLLELALLGAQAAIDQRTLHGLLRLSDDIKRHLRELGALLEN